MSDGPDIEFDYEPPKRRSLRTFAQRGPAGKSGWITALIVTAGGIIAQLIQVRAADAQKLEYVAAGQSLDAKIDKLSDRIFDLTQRVTKIETARDAEAVAAAAPVPLIKGKKK